MSRGGYGRGHSGGPGRRQRRRRREATTTQVRNPGTTAPAFDGYGYFVWTGTRYAPGTFWAAGWGGQRIGWSTRPDNARILLTFGNSDRLMPELYRAASPWIGP